MVKKLDLQTLLSVFSPPPPSQIPKSGYWYAFCLDGWMGTSLAPEWCMNFIHVQYSRGHQSHCPMNMNILGTKNRGHSDGPQNKMVIFSKTFITILIKFQ
jgi:hypothetical protein